MPRPGTYCLVLLTDHTVHHNPLTSLYSINSFFGIKFAAPPTGNLRWQPPVNIESRNNFSSKGAPINASATGPACVQGNPAWQGMPPGGAGQSEDCLLLDVKVPANPTSKFLPVAIQIHGGGELSCSADSILHGLLTYASLGYATGNAAQVSAGDALIYQSKGNLIYVSIQYRLGAYGFLGGADVAAHGTLNAGLLDQRAAIEWYVISSGISGRL
jgi:carboxylesterase type B